ncbi:MULTISPECIES: hypothetical protein [Brachybacterium]|uniref:DUF4304 domain-containing protein n=1 Tax=Brachybacterium kimchii TaxID=2942909 RepID=A0ABY4N8X6_9MICO|nr:MULTISPECIES: hypothetical protein [Brachybacterium]MCG7309717.1 hypothetical protein [Brachybacterium sp. ACRRE]UQN30564.1 hypothetical protein M4486_04425 [Brachybacterium kimchii]
MSTYAKSTTVDPSRSRAEIESVLARYGATGFGYATEDDGETSRAAVTFIAHGRQVRFLMTMPSRSDRKFTRTPERGTPRSADAAFKAWEQACRQRWRALALVIKAKLEAVESGIVTFEAEFLAHTIVPGTGQTVSEQIEPSLALAIESGRAPAMLQIESGSTR